MRGVIDNAAADSVGGGLVNQSASLSELTARTYGYRKAMMISLLGECIRVSVYQCICA